MVIAPARRAGVPGSNPGPGENFSLKLLIYIDSYFVNQMNNGDINMIKLINSVSNKSINMMIIVLKIWNFNVA